MESQFKALNDSGRTLYAHRTCATDTDQVEQILASVTDTIIAGSLKSSGIR